MHESEQRKFPVSISDFFFQFQNTSFHIIIIFNSLDLLTSLDVFRSHKYNVMLEPIIIIKFKNFELGGFSV